MTDECPNSGPEVVVHSMRGVQGKFLEPLGRPGLRSVDEAATATTAATTPTSTFSSSSLNAWRGSSGGRGGQVSPNSTTSSSASSYLTLLTPSASTNSSTFTSPGNGGMAMMNGAGSTEPALCGARSACLAWKERLRRRMGGADCMSSFRKKENKLL